jgi:hypothetical protein
LLNDSVTGTIGSFVIVAHPAKHNAAAAMNTRFMIESPVKETSPSSYRQKSENILQLLAALLSPSAQRKYRVLPIVSVTPSPHFVYA